MPGSVIRRVFSDAWNLSYWGMSMLSLVAGVRLRFLRMCMPKVVRLLPGRPGVVKVIEYNRGFQASYVYQGGTDFTDSRVKYWP